MLTKKGQIQHPRFVVAYAVLGVALAIVLLVYMQSLQMTTDIQRNFLNDLIVVDGIMLGFYGVLAGQDFAKESRVQLRADIAVMILFLFSLFGGLLGVIQTGNLLSSYWISIPFLAMIYGTLLIFLRLIVAVYFDHPAGIAAKT